MALPMRKALTQLMWMLQLHGLTLNRLIHVAFPIRS